MSLEARGSVPVALVVDDDPVLRTIGAEALGAIGFEVLEAETGEAAIELAESRVPDLVVLDIQLPGRDGLSTCQELRRQAHMREVPILVITGRTDAQTIDRTFEVGATDFMKKPLDWQLLQHRVRFLMRANTAFADLRNTRDDLQRSQRELDMARELGHIGTWELDPDTDQMLWSEELHRLLGTSPRAGAPPTWSGFLSLIPEDDRADFRRAVAQAVSTQRPATVEHGLVGIRGDMRFVHQYVEVGESPTGERRVCGTIQDVTERRRAEAQVQYLESFDGLTQLPNRTYLHDRLERLVRRGRKDGHNVAILCVDLDRFERVNQALGYAVGDDLLRAVGQRLLDSVRATDFVGRGVELPDVSRFGGDEFTIVLTGAVVEDTARQAAERIIECLAEPFSLGDLSLPLSASIGIALLDQHADADALITHAGMAMAVAKKTGGGTYRIFDASTRESAVDQLALESDLAAAIENEELYLDYQPLTDAATGRVVGVEALVRWNHPAQGRLMPGQFIPIAETTGLIGPLGEWSLRRACRQAREWDAAGLSPFRVSCNVSSLQFNRSQVVGMVREALEETGLEPERLEIEITETALLGNESHVRSTCDALRDLGVGLALDDFGTGYSSLSHLFDFHIDTIKIDRSFTAKIQPGDKACGIISAVIGMARRMNLRVVAEGVEEEEQQRFLVGEGCHVLQGFGICRPTTPEAIVDFARSRS